MESARDHESARVERDDGEHVTSRTDVEPHPVGSVGGLADGPLERLTRTAATASVAGEWGVVVAALEELRSWRLAQAGPDVVDLDAERSRGRARR